MEKFEPKINKLKREKGSVTLFVLIAMIFFLVVLFTWYSSAKNKLIEQEKEIKIIQNEYNTEGIDQKYSDTISNLDLNVAISLYKETGEKYSVSEWTNKNLKLQIYYPDDVTEEEKYYYINGVKTPYVENSLITENCTISVKYKDKTKQVKISRIDKLPPTVQIFPNGADIRTSNETGTITAQVKGTDNLSGIKKIKYAWSTSNTEEPGEEEFQEIQNGGRITKEYPLGVYYMWIKAIDIAENEEKLVSNSYTIREPLPPTVTMRYNDASGELYTGEWTNQDIYTEITVPESEGNVEKYEYSFDKTKWNTIDEEIAPTELNYTTTFPMSRENKPEWLGDLTANGTYYFIEDGNGSISSNNQGQHNQVANSYIKIDLSSFSEEDLLNISINAQVSSEGSCDIGYATITENTSIPSYSNSTGQFIKISGTGNNVITPTDYSITELLKGGKTYYLHFGYRKDGSVNTGNDKFTVNSITLTSETLGKGINFYEYNKIQNKVTYKLQEDLKQDVYFRALYDDNSYSKDSSAYNIRIDKTAPKADIDYDFTGKNSSKIIISNIIEKGSGLKGYYISTNEETPTKDSSWIENSENEINIENLLIETTYYVWLIDNVGNISDKYTVEIETPNYLVDNQIYTKTLENAINKSTDGSVIKLLNDYFDESTVNINKNVTLDVQNYTLTRNNTITIASSKEVSIIGDGIITSNTNNYTVTNNGTLNINMQGKIENTETSSNYGSIYNYGTLNVNSGNIEGYYRGIYNNSAATININNGKIIATNGYGIYYYGTVNIYSGIIQGSYGIYYGIVNIYGGNIIGTNSYGIYTSNTITMNGGNVKGKSRGIYLYYGSLTVNDGYIEGDYGVESYNGILNILGGEIEGKTNGIYVNSYNRTTIGNINDDVNYNNPIISGGAYGIRIGNNSYNYNFNNGMIQGMNTIPYTETIVPREGYMVYTYYDYDGYKKYCSILIPTVNEITIDQTPANWTNEDVSVQVRYPILPGAILQFSEDKENWEDVNNGYTTNISENKTVYARMLDSSGIVVAEEEHEITNIDKIAPTVTISPETTKYTIYDHGESSVNINVAATFLDEGGSELNTCYYGWSTSREEEPTEWIELESGDNINKECNLGTYYLWLNISDNAGNKSEIDKIRYIVELEEAVARIGDNYYYTIQDAFDAAGATISTVEIIKDTDEVATVEEGQTITLDLQGHIVGSSTSDQAVITNNGTLTIIDTNNSKKGTIENLIGTGILNNGTLTLGDNSTEIEDDTPTISGKKKGIVNNNILNYYDGTIIGKIAIEGEVQDTPESYGPVGEYEDGVTKVNLRVISDYVARIEWFYYTTLQSAIDACEAKKDNEKETTIIMLKDIILEDSVNVYYGQNVKLDLHGYTLTSLNNSVITNYGNLDIIDLSEQQTGNIDANRIIAIRNYNKGTLNIEDGVDINSNNTTIYNYNSGIININGGNISNTGYSAIYNNDEGCINLKGGSINTTGTNGIYNRIGIVNITGGSINCPIGQTSGSRYGINNSNGIVNFYNGNINCETNNQYVYGISNGAGTINVFDGYININATSIYTSGNVYYAEGIQTSSGTLNVLGGNITVKHTRNVYSYGIRIGDNGIVNMNGGIIESDQYGIYNYRLGIINMNGGIINADGSGIHIYQNGLINMKDGVINAWVGISFDTGSSGGTLNMNGGTINAKSTGISQYRGTINLLGGFVNCSSDKNSVIGIYTYYPEGIVNIGQIDNNVSITEPHIKAEYTGEKDNCSGCGIYNYLQSGGYNFYGGIIQASTTCDMSSISEIREGYQIEEEVIDGCETIYLVEQEERYIVRNETTGEQYISLQDAIDGSQDNEQTNLKLLVDFKLTTKFEIPENKNINLDLAGNSITNKNFTIINSGTLTIKDSSNGGSIKCFNRVTSINNTGKFILQNGAIVSNNNSAYDTYTIYNEISGTINILGGEILDSSVCLYNSSSYNYVIYNKGLLYMQDGMISYNSDNTKTSMVYYNCFGIMNNNKGVINIKGGIINCVAKSCQGVGNCTNYCIYNGNGSANIENLDMYVGGTMYGSSYSNSRSAIGIYNGSGTIKVINTKITSTCEPRGSSCGIQNNGSGIVKIINGEIISTSESQGSSCGIKNDSNGEINILNGKIHVINNGVYNQSNSYGIFNNSLGTIRIGNKDDGIVSNTEPNIKAEYTGTNTSYSAYYGIYNKQGELYFYDGRIEGSTLAIEPNSRITEREENTEFLYENDDKVLTLTTEAMDIAKIGETTYSSLQEAIDAAGTNQTNIELLRGIQYTNQDSSITVTQGQDITLDLKGFSIISAIEDSVIKNNGKLKITDSSEQAKGKISGSYENTIHNKPGATLEINNGTITRVIAKDNVIYNEGTLNITGGNILQTEGSETGNTIYNAENSNLNMSSGTISGGSNSIYNQGNVNITDGTIENTITNTNSGTFEMSNGTLTGTIQNSENASIEITGGNITTPNLIDEYSIKNTSTNTVNILGGTISSGIDSSSGTINIGTKDGSIIETPLILGDTYGINVQGGVLNIYDGTIKGKTAAINGEITELEEQSEIVVNKDENYEIITLVKKDTPLAQVGTEEYYSLEEAIDSISNSGTVKILREGTVENTLNNLTGKEIALDLNGNTLKMYTRIQNTGTLKIKDSSSEQTGNIISYKDSPIYNSGNLEFISGNISENSYGIYNQANGATVISGGNLNNNTYGIYTVGGTVNVTGGNITQNTYGIFANEGTISISGGNITNNEYGIYNSSGTTNITAGTINTNTYGIYGQNGIINISNITLTGNSKELYNNGTAVINITNSNITSTGEIPIKNMSTGTINIISGTITTTGETAVENAGTGTIVVGSQDGAVTSETPIIQAEEYGITNSGNGTIKFYDGTIKGKKGGLSGLYLYLETGYKVKTEYVDNYYCDTLALAGTVSTVAKIGGIEYTNLQSAINACTQEDEATTITLVNSINTNTTFVVEEGQNIIIDLNGKNIISSEAESTIENAGTLSIIDTHEAQTGKISNSYMAAIKNTGTLTLGENDGTVSTTCPEIIGNTFGIINSGTFNFFDGTIEASKAVDGNITSRATGYVINKTTTDGIEKLVLAR